MPIAYYGVSLSPNWVETPEEYVIFKNAVIGRTGFQAYKGRELDPDELKAQDIVVDDEDDVNLYRDPDEVFSPKTIASFEGKSVTDGHPSELLNVDTVKNHEQGQVLNVRRGTEPLESGDLPLLADLIVKSKPLIDKIKAGLRELSCGYNYHVLKDGELIRQVDIIGNHVAIVESGRAGHEAAIGDSKEPALTERVTMSVLAVFDRMITRSRKAQIAAWAKDAKPDEVAEMLDTMSTELEKKTPTMVDEVKAAAKDEEKPPEKKEEPESKDASDARKRFHDALDRMLDGAEEAAASKDADAEELSNLVKKWGKSGSDAEDEEEEKKEGEGEDEGNDEGSDTAGALTIEPSDRPEKPGAGVDAADAREIRKQAVRNFVRLLKPIIADSRDKKLIAVFDTASKMALGKSTGKTSGGYGSVAVAANKRSRAAQDSLEASEVNKQNLKRIADAEKQYKDRFNKRAKVDTEL
jgi:hypothetical protein